MAFWNKDKEEDVKPTKKSVSSAPKLGRPTKFTDERIGKIVKSLGSGMTRSAACMLAGVSKSTFYQWKADNPEFGRSDGSLMHFLDAVEKAEAEAQDELLRDIRKDKGGAKWIMARRFRRDWGDKLDVNTTGEQRVKILVEYADIEGYTSETAQSAAAGFERGGEVQRSGLRTEMGQDSDRN